MSIRAIVVEMLTIAALSSAAAGYHDLRRWLRHWLRRTVVYKHRFGAQAGQHLHYRIVYVGISNRPGCAGSGDATPPRSGSRQ